MAQKSFRNLLRIMTASVFIGVTLASSALFAGEPPPVPQPAPSCHYDWGTGIDGWGYCFLYNEEGEILNGGQAVPNSYCEANNPSHYDWGRATNGFGYCFQFSPYGLVLNQGHAVSNYHCEEVRRSYFAWGRGIDGFTYCFQFTPNGDVMNDGHSVPNGYCGGYK